MSAFAVLVAVVLAGAAAGVEELFPSGSEVVPAELVEGVWFGDSCALSGDNLCCSAPLEDTVGPDAGAVYCFRFNAATALFEETAVVLRGAAERDQFGESVALDGDNGIVGAIRAGIGGECAIIQRSAAGNWERVLTLSPASAETNDFFGSGVSIDGNIAACGAPSADPDGVSSAGRVSVWVTDDNWQSATEHELTASDAQRSDFLGRGVSVSGQFVAVAAHGAGVGGRVYIFEKQGGVFVEKATIEQRDPETFDQFGYSISLEAGDRLRLLVGAYGDDDSGSDSGSAYLYESDDGTTWGEVVKLTAAGGLALDNFGFSVDLAGSHAIVGAWRSHDNEGSAHLFVTVDGSTWEETEVLRDGTPVGGTRFGHVVTMDDGKIVVGAPRDDARGADSGAAFLFFPTPLTASPVLELELAACGGAGSVAVHGATPRGDVALILSATACDEVLPSSAQCAGTHLPISVYNYIGHIVITADDAGLAVLSMDSVAFCGKHLAALDLATCGVSGALLVEAEADE